METHENIEEYKVYKLRYALLGTVVLLNISNATLWINYSPVATTVADFYDVTTVAVNWFSLVYLIISFPFGFISSFITGRYGLKYTIHIGASLNVVGAGIRALGTSAAFSDQSTQYAISLTGQVISAMGQSFILFIPTKVSQTWFPENQRTIATTAMAMSNPLGIVIAEICVPFIVQNPENVPTNNYIWFLIAIIAEGCVIAFVTRAKPKTPPSRSALQQDNKTKSPYLHQLRSAFTTPAYMYLFFCLGAGIGLFNGIATLTQQLLCTLGYKDVVGGAANAFMVLMGFVGSAVTGILADKTKKFTEITKMAFAGAAFFAIFMIQFYLFPDHTAALIIFCGLFGLFGIGGYPIGLELAVETIYPVEETISTAFIFLSGQIQGIFIIVLVPLLAKTQDLEDSRISVCSSDGNDNESLDYTVPLLILSAYMVIVVGAMIIFMKTRYKRLEAEQQSQNQNQPIPISISVTL